MTVGFLNRGSTIQCVFCTGFCISRDRYFCVINSDAISLNISNAVCGGTLKNSLFWRIRKSVNRSMDLCTNFSTSLNFVVFIVAYISKGNGTAVLSSSFERISTGRELLPIFTQSSRKLGFVRIYTYPISFSVILLLFESLCAALYVLHCKISKKI